MGDTIAPAHTCGQTGYSAHCPTGDGGPHACSKPQGAHSVHRCTCGHEWVPAASYHRNHPYR